MSKEKAIVFGRGQYFSFKETTLKDRYEIIGFLDNNPNFKFSDSENKNVKVVFPTEVNIFQKDIPILIMVSRSSFIEIARQLLELNIEENRIIFGTNLEPEFDMGEKFLKKCGGGVKIEDGKIYVYGEFGKIEINSSSDYITVIRHLSEEKNPVLKVLKEMPCEPYSRSFGREYGTPIDRYYIEKFLEENKQVICGDVMEIADDIYIRRFGHDITNKMILHVNGWNGAIKGNLATGEGIEEGMVDCLICTQTIQMIFDIELAMSNIYKLLKPNGVALITIHGISQISRGDDTNWGEYWRVTPKTMYQLALKGGFAENEITIFSYGNVKVTTCFLYGLCKEQLSELDYEYHDDMYPLIIAAKLKKISTNYQ